VAVACIESIKYKCDSVETVKIVSQLAFSEYFLCKEPCNGCSEILLEKCFC
jgi:hypothetical protein